MQKLYLDKSNTSTNSYDAADILNQRERGCFSQKYVLHKKEQLLFSKKDANEEEPQESIMSAMDVDNMLLTEETKTQNFLVPAAQSQPQNFI